MIKACILIFLGILIYIVGFCMGSSWIFKRKMESIKKSMKAREKAYRMFSVMNYWMKLRDENKRIADYLINMQYRNIAIYGMGHLGKHLLKELSELTINVNYIIDRSMDIFDGEIRVYNPQNDLPNVDAIIVTAIADFDEIEAMLRAKVDCPIISLEEIVYEM